MLVRWPKLPTILLAALVSAGLGTVAPTSVQARDGGGNDSGHGGGGDDHSGPGGGDDHSGPGDGDDHSGPDGGDDRSGRDNDRDKGGGGFSGWDNSGSSEARDAVAKGRALSLKAVMPVVRKALPGRVLDVDLRQVPAGGWVYKFLVLTGEGRYHEVFVDALHNRIVSVRDR